MSDKQQITVRGLRTSIAGMVGAKLPGAVHELLLGEAHFLACRSNAKFVLNNSSIQIASDQDSIKIEPVMGCGFG